MAYDGGFMVHQEPDFIQPPPTYKRSWQELQKAVKCSKNLGAMLSVRVPNSFDFGQVKGNLCRIYFLGARLNGSRLNSIAFVDIDVLGANSQQTLEWKYLLEEVQLGGSPKLSKEEELLRERKRLSSRGITSFEYDKEGLFVFPTGNSLYGCFDKFGYENPEVRIFDADAVHLHTNLSTVNTRIIYTYFIDVQLLL